jgi:hypothetical protein
MSSDADFFRYKITHPDGREYFSRSYRAKGPATSAMNYELKWTRNSEKKYTIQKLAAVIRYEENYNYDGVLYETPVASLEWVDLETR